MERCFIHHNRAWYSYSSNQPIHHWEDEVCFSVITDAGVNEFFVRWYKTGEHKISAKFECFDNTWAVLGEIQDVLDAMQQEEALNSSPMDFCNLLMLLGFMDNTEEHDISVKV